MAVDESLDLTIQHRSGQYANTVNSRIGSNSDIFPWPRRGSDTWENNDSSVLGIWATFVDGCSA